MHERKDTLPEGAVVWSSHQTSGRGVQGRWHDTPNQSLLFSLLIKPHFLPLRKQAYLTLISSLATQQTLLPTTDSQVKWPNDVLVKEDKISGSLTEVRARQNRLCWGIVGVGINVHQTSFPFPLATSLRLCAPNKVIPPLKQLLNTWHQHFFARYEELKSGNYESIRKKYESVLYLKGCQQHFLYQGHPLSGRIVGIRPSGALCLRTDEKDVEITDNKSLVYLSRKQASP